jgi:dipeptidyl aminopeptidase/acylaminoacyl peptidase
MTNHDADPLATWLRQGPDHGPIAGLDATFARLPSVRQRPAWLVSLSGDTISARPAERRLRLGLAVAAGLIVVVVGGLALSGGVPPTPDSTRVTPSPSSNGTPIPTVAPDVIVYSERMELAFGEDGCTQDFGCSRSWVAVADVDGSNPRRLFPDAEPHQRVAAVSPDGTAMIVTGLDAAQLGPRTVYYLTDVAGAEPVILDTGCAGSCGDDFFGFSAFSPDGRSLAMVRNFGEDPNLWPGESTVIAILDLATGEVVELDSTVARNPDVGPPCHLGCGEGSNDAPSWSADGSRLLFARSGIGTPNEPRTIHDTVLFVVDADGANLRQLVPTELFARDAQWSPDGSLIAFTSGIEVLSLDDFGLLENWHQLNDIYTVRPDGTNIRRLTRFTAGPVPEAPGDLGPSGPMWTRDGRIVFQRRVGDPADPGSSASDWELWVMDSDGGNATRLDGEATTMTAAGCVICAYPFPDSGDYPRFAFWRALP